MRTRTIAVAAFLLLATLAHAQTEDCRQRLMGSMILRQLYARGAGMGVRVPAVPQAIEGLTAARVLDVAARKLEAHELIDPNASQWLAINLNVGSVAFSMFVALRRWAAHGSIGGVAATGAWSATLYGIDNEHSSLMDNDDYTTDKYPAAGVAGWFNAATTDDSPAIAGAFGAACTTGTMCAK